MTETIAYWRTVKFKNRLVLICSLLLVIVATAVLAYQARQRNELIYQNIRAERQSSFEEISKLKSNQLKGLTLENTYWDDMVNFIKKPNQMFITETIEAQLETNQADAIWTYSPSYNLVSNTNRFVGSNSTLELGLSAADLKSMFAKTYYTQYYQQTAEGVLEVFGATVVSSNNPEHTEVPKGYFFVARKIDANYLRTFSDDSHDTITIAGPTQALERTEFDPEDGRIAFDKLLYSYDGSVQGRLHIVYDNSRIGSVFQREKNIFFIIVLVYILTNVGIYIALNRMVNRPLTQIYRALLSGHTKSLSQLLKQQTEFGKIADLIVTAESQKASLSRSVLETDQARQALEGRTAELETINRLMVNRELKMIELKQELQRLKANNKKDKI